MINIVLCADERYAPYCAVVMLTAMAHAVAPAEVHFHILTPGLTPKTTQALQDMVNRHGALLEVVTTKDALPDGVKLGRFGIGALIRLYIHRYLPSDCKRAIYLDCDLLVLGDVAELWASNLADNAIGAVTDLCSPDTYAKHDSSFPYCNTGVLVIDMPLWRQHSIGEQALHHISHSTQALRFPDQDALNHVLQGRWASLDLAWNFQPTAYTAMEKNYAYLRTRRLELEQAIRHPKIVHFIGGVKPWHAECTHPLQDLFIHFSRYTPWPIDKAALMATLPAAKRLRQSCKAMKIWNRRRKLAYQLPQNFQ